MPARRTTSHPASTESSPQKSRAKKGPAAPAQRTSKTLESFFRNPPPAPAKKPQRLDSRGEEEFIEDIEDDDLAGIDQANAAPDQKDKKRSWAVSAGEHSSAPAQRSVSSKFMKTETARIRRPQTADAPAERPWTEQYAPRDLTELAVHHKKVADVRSWLEGVLKGQVYQRLLVLRGAAGTGKSTTVSLLARELACELVEWKNPETAEYGSGRYVSTSSMFAEFMSRAGKFTGLELVASNADTSTSTVKDSLSKSDRQILMVEEFPSTGGNSPVALTLFREQLLQYLATSIRSKAGFGGPPPVPLVLVISEAVLSSTNSADNFTAHRLLGPDILQHAGVTVIDFNPVAPTFIAKALKTVIQKHTRHSGRVQNVTPGIIKVVSEVGDVRNAISTLEYLTKDPQMMASQPSISSKSSNKSKSRQKAQASSNAPNAVVDPLEERAMSVIALREGTIGLFHAIGKVLYNKRGEESSDTPTNRPLPDLDVDLLITSAGTDPSTFLSALHENYILSCFDQYGDSEATLDSVNGCIDAMSDADLLGSFGGGGISGRSTRQYFPAASEGLRQEAVAAHVGIMGVQESLPYPVKRQAISESTSKRRDHHRMFYPTELKLWRQREEVQSSIDYLVGRMMDGRLLASLPTVQHGRIISQPGRVEGSGPGLASSSRPAAPKQDDSEEAAYTSLSSGQSARLTMLLERLPFMKQVYAGQTGKLSGIAARYTRQIEDAVSFNGLDVRQDEESDDEEEAPSRSMKRVSFGGAAGLEAHGKDGSEEMEKLMLDEDPIDDDD